MKLSEKLDIAARIHAGIGGQSSLAETIREAADLARKVEAAPADTEAALVLLESTANMLRGMLFDPAIPDHTKRACEQQAAEIDAFTEGA